MVRMQGASMRPARSRSTGSWIDSSPFGGTLDQSVVIIGAGLAGASAALRLAKSGVRSLVLEARDRYGGRAFLRPFAGDDIHKKRLAFCCGKGE